MGSATVNAMADASFFEAARHCYDIRGRRTWYFRMPNDERQLVLVRNAGSTCGNDGVELLGVRGGFTQCRGTVDESGGAANDQCSNLDHRNGVAR